MTRNVKAAIGVLALTSGLVLGSTLAAADTKIRLTLDWIAQSTHAIQFIPQFEGYYKAQGLDVKIDAGRPSRARARWC